jgi:hypothetical protein
MEGMRERFPPPLEVTPVVHFLKDTTFGSDLPDIEGACRVGPGIAGDGDALRISPGVPRIRNTPCIGGTCFRSRFGAQQC